MSRPVSETAASFADSGAKMKSFRTAAKSSGIVVTPVTTWRDRKAFLKFPWRLYRGDPNWIPPLRGDQKELVGYRPHPFYERNHVQTFLARRGPEVCGRVAAILNREHIEFRNDPRGFFGFFECVDDQDAADGLFDAVREWFAQDGIANLRGPANPSINYVLGLLVDGFDFPPTFMMPYNPSYYPRLIENYGFRKAQDLYAYWGHKDMMPANAAKFRPFVEKVVERYNLHLRPLDTKHFVEDVETFLRIYNEALRNMWGFSPMSPREVRHMAEGLRHLMVPELAIAAELDGRMIGAVFALPDYNPRIRQIDGRLFPFGFLRLLRKKQEIRKIRILAATVLPEFSMMGIGLVLLRAVAQGPRMGVGRGRVLLGSGVQPLLARQPRKGTREASEDLPHLRLDFRH